MSGQSWSRIKSLFFAASEVDPVERSRYLAQQPKVNTEMRAEVKQLLADHDEAGTFLNAGPLPPDETEILNGSAAQFTTGEVVSGRYRIRRYVARGGMGEVYEADDLELDIVVAMKTLRPAVFAGEALLGRFKREVDLARRVTHPNIGRIFDIGHHRGTDGQDIAFLTMEFLPGETLAQRISRLGPIPESEALPLVRDMVRALDAIHQNGIVHRDFKSANVMLVGQPSGTLCARVMDFGLARPTAPVQNTFTQKGFVSGTPAYMAPEQFDNISSPASDIYALGVVIQEMLTGIRPARARRDATSTSQVPSEWAAIIRRCLAIDSADRFQNAGELLEQLPGSTLNRIAPRITASTLRRWAFTAVIGMLLASILAIAVWRTRSPVPNPDTPKHLALLPIQSESADPAEAAFCAGLSDTLRGDLAEMETTSRNVLWVIPSAEVRTIKTPSQALRQVGANLVLTATLQRTANGFLLQVELVDPLNQHLLKSARIEAASVSALRQAAIARVAALLDVPVGTVASREVAESTSIEPGATEFYEQGLGYLKGDNIRNLDHSIELFNKALLKDKQYALAYAGLGEAYASKYEATKDPQWMQAALENGKTSLRLNDRLSQVHSTMGLIYQMTGRADFAISELKKAIEIEPSCMSCYHHMGDVYLDLGNLDAAEACFNTIVRHQRGNVLGYSGLGKVAEKKGRYATAAEMYKKVVDLAPDRPKGYANLGGIYVEMGRYEEAVPLLQRALVMQPFDQAYSNLAAAFIYLGRYREAVDAILHAIQLTRNNHDYWRNLGDSYRQVPELRAKAPSAYQEALKYANAALVIKPGDSDLLSSIGLYYAHLGDSGRASSFTDQALKAAPGDSSVLFTAALAAELAGRRRDALNFLAAAAKAGYSLSDIEKEPELLDLHGDPDYRRFLKAMNNPPAGVAK